MLDMIVIGLGMILYMDWAGRWGALFMLAGVGLIFGGTVFDREVEEVLTNIGYLSLVASVYFAFTQDEAEEYPGSTKG